MTEPLPQSHHGALYRAWRIQHVLRKTLHSTAKLRRLPANPDPADIFEISQDWGKNLCNRVGLRQEITGTPYLDEPCLYVANHVSYLDIVFLMSLLPITFIAKKEVAEWPIFGAGATAAGTVFINRSSSRSRSLVAQTIGDAITQQKKSIAIFPEGTSSMDMKPWKRGVFSVAKEFGFKVQPIRIFYQPLRTAAFIDEDSLMPHLWNLLGTDTLEGSLEFFPPVVIKDTNKDTAEIEAQVRASFNKKLAETTHDL